MYLPNQNVIPDDLNFTTTARTPYLTGGDDDDDDDVVNLHINFNMKWLEIQNGGRLSLHGTIMVMYWWLMSM
jgi:hypothetical protein